MSLAGPSRRVSPTLFPTPPPTANPLSRPWQIHAPKQNARHHFSPAHQVLPDSPDQEVDDGREEELRVLERKAQLLARPIPCPWRQLLPCGTQCDAVLASLDVLQRHIDWHMHEHRQVLLDDANDTGLKCFYERCPQYGFSTVGQLETHVHAVHLVKAVNAVIKDGMETGRSMRPFRPRTRKPPELPIVPIPPYLISTRPVLPKVASMRAVITPIPTAPVHAVLRQCAVSESTTSSRSSRSEFKRPIMPRRDPDDFWPMNGEADVQTSSYWPSSSIFPRIVPMDRNRLEREWYQIQTKGSWLKGSELSIRKRTPGDRVPIFEGADVVMRRRKAELEEERKSLYKRVKAMESDVKGKGKAVATDMDMEEKVDGDLSGAASGSRTPLTSGAVNGGERYPIERITRASTKRARRVTGRSVGIAAIEEMIAFEQEGVELGELPEDFSFAK